MALSNLYVALIHFPVMNRKGKEIGSALTTIDLHDIARACCTFGVKGFYVVTPFDDQADLADQVIRHWTRGVGGELNPSRKQALELIRVTSTFDQALEEIRDKTKTGTPGQIEPDTAGQRPNNHVVTIATSAKRLEGSITTDQLKQKLDSNAAHVLAFGTAWGLTDDFIDSCDLKLCSITGPGEYNHLSVRSAASIYLDRITNG